MNAHPKFIATAAHVDEAAVQPLPRSRKVYFEGSRRDIRVPMREVSQSDTPAAFGAEANQIGTAAAGAVAALVVVGGVAFLIRGWLSRIPREWLRFAVGLLLAAFGTFWAAEGARVRWPGGDLSLLGLLAVMASAAFAYLALLRFHAATRPTAS